MGVRGRGGEGKPKLLIKGESEGRTCCGKPVTVTVRVLAGWATMYAVPSRHFCSVSPCCR